MGDKTLKDILNIGREPDALHFFLDTRHIVTYSGHLAAFPGKEISMQKYGFPGFVYINTNFFHKLEAGKHPGSDMVNLAKAFFTFDDSNHVCLVQFLMREGRSGKHYHALDEYITCIAGAANVRLSTPENDADAKEVIIRHGDMLHIPSNTVHVLHSPEGSITIPIKQTIKGKKDHYYA